MNYFIQVRKLLFFALFIVVCMSSCVTVSPHDYARTSIPEATDVINRLKNDTLIVVIPTYYDKERLLKNMKISKPSDIAKREKRLSELYEDRENEAIYFIDAIEKHYDFSPYFYIPDSLVHKFEAGENGIFFLNKNLEFDPSITYFNRRPIKMLKQYDLEWQIRIENEMIPNPFPNHAGGGSSLFWILGLVDYSDLYPKAVYNFNRRFHVYYNNPTRLVRY